MSNLDNFEVDSFNSASMDFDFTVNDVLFTVNPDNIKNKDSTVFNIPFCVTIHVPKMVSNISSGTLIHDGIDYRNINNFDRFVAFYICKMLGVRDFAIDESVSKMTDEWVNMDKNGYIYYLHLLYPNAVDWRLFFRTHPYPFIVLINALEIDEFKNNINRRIELIKFFESYPIESIFDESNAETQGRLILLEKMRSNVDKYFMIYPLDDAVRKTMKYTPTKHASDELWQKDTIDSTPMPEEGSEVIVDMKTFLERFDDYTCGLFKKSPNPDIQESESFPYEGVVITGSSILQNLSYEYKPRSSSDVDIFIYGPNYKKNAETFKKLIRWFQSPTTYFGIRGSVVYIYIEDVPRNFQIICGNFKTPYSIINRFDTSQLQFAYYLPSTKDDVFTIEEMENKVVAVVSEVREGMQIFCTHLAYKTIQDRVAVINKWAFKNNTSKIRAPRFVKTMLSGYHILIDNDVKENILDFGQLLKTNGNKTIPDIINDIYSYYYPSSVMAKHIPEENRKNYYMGMIRIYSKCATVSQNVKDVVSNVVINGNFDTDYESINFGTFQINSIRFTNVRRMFTTDIRDVFGTIRLLSSYCTVVTVSHGDDSLEITLRVKDPALKKFFEETLEVQTMRIYTPMMVTQKILTNDCFTVKFYEHDINRKIQRGYSVMKDSRGESLDIFEDLRVGDEVQVMFSMEVTVDNIRFIKIKPHNLIKKFIEGERDQTVIMNETTATSIEGKLRNAIREIKEEPEFKELEFDV